jgi:hypothetical protein
VLSNCSSNTESVSLFSRHYIPKLSKGHQVMGGLFLCPNPIRFCILLLIGTSLCYKGRQKKRLEVAI